MTTNKINEELEKLYTIFNTKYFENTLPSVMILVQKSIEKGKRNILGWMTPNKVWSSSKEEFYELSLSAEYLNRPFEELCSTLLHEMVHIFNIQNNIKDTSNNNVYHNKRFKQEAEKRGLIIEKCPTIGYSLTKLQEATLEFVNSIITIDKSIFGMSRKKFSKIITQSKKQYTYICKCKKNSIRSFNSSLACKCLICNEEFTIKE